MWAKQKQQPGFTIVELLIVIVVIGILAAISIVAFNGIQDRANDTAIRSDLVNIAKQLETIKATSSTTNYPTTTELANTNKLSVAKDSYEPSRNNLYYCRTSDNLHYAIGAVSKSGKETFVVDGTIKDASVAVWGASTCDQLTVYSASNTGVASGFNSASVPPSWASWIK